MSKVMGIVLAAGQGARMGSKTPKQYLSVGGRPVLAHTLELFQKSNLVHQVVLVVGTQEMERARELVAHYRLDKVSRLVMGGATRSHSVSRGLAMLPEDCSWVVVHDGVRPFFSLELLERVIQEAKTRGAAIPGVPVKDTIKICDHRGQVVSTPPRQNLWSIQTPQVFRKDWLMEAYACLQENLAAATDDASLLEQLGKPVQVVLGEYDNIKLTTPEDLELAAAIWERRQGQCG